MALLSALRQIAGISAGPLSDALKAELYTLVLGTFSLPINVPGTNYSKGLQVLFFLSFFLVTLQYLKTSEGRKKKKSSWTTEPHLTAAVLVFQARKKLVAMLRQMIADRRSSGCARDDMLDALLSGNEGTRAKLSDDQIIDLLITLIYSGYETVSTTSMMAVKYLSDNPKALGQIRVHITSATELNSTAKKKKTISPVIHELRDGLLAVAERAP
jgi:brassinosteroid-6-oxidase 1